MSADFTGSWQADIPKSRFIGPQPSALRIEIELRDRQLRQELIVTRADGGEDRGVFVCSTTGDGGTSLLNGNPIRSAAKWNCDELVIETWVKLGEREVYFCDCWSLSPDGRTLVMEHRNDALAGQRVVLERIG